MIISVKLKKALFAGLFLILFHLSIAAPGGTSPNPTGGFGSTDPATSTSANPTGGFGAGTDMPLAEPPPPPPVPTPLDGGVSLLIAATLGLGVKKLYFEIKNK